MLRLSRSTEYYSHIWTVCASTIDAWVEIWTSSVLYTVKPRLDAPNTACLRDGGSLSYRF
jgi:hypothetical protein